MFVADFLYVNYVFRNGVLLIIMLTKDKYLTSRLTSSHFLTLNYERRLKRGRAKPNTVFRVHKTKTNM